MTSSSSTRRSPYDRLTLAAGALPGVRAARRYQREWLRGDVTSGFAVTALMIPHGMAYAELAGLPAVTGLYTTITAVVTYAVFGPSRLLLLGPDSSLAPLIAAAIATVGADSAGEAIALAGLLAMMTGLIGVVAGLLRLGSLAELLSRPVQIGYLNGLAIVMVISQAARLAGFTSNGTSPIDRAWAFVEGALAGRVVAIALVLGLTTLLAIEVLDRRSRTVPTVLVAVAGTMLAVWAFGLDDRGVAVVGALPEGLPTPTWPSVELTSWPSLVLASLGLAWMMLSDTTAVSRSFAGRDGDRVDPNHEVRALGVSNIATGAMQGFPVSASSSRTAIAWASGGHTQLVGLISAALLVVVLLAGRGLTAYLPSAALAAVVIAAAIRLFDVEQVRWLYAARRSEFVLCVGTTAGVVAVGVLNGLLIAVALSLINFVRLMWRPYDAVLGRVDNRSGYHDLDRHPNGRQVPGLVVFRFDAPLFFANADHFERRVLELVASADPPLTRVVIMGEPITDIDTSAAAMLAALDARLVRDGVDLAFAGLRGPVKDRLRRYGVYEQFGERRFHSTVDSAIAAFKGEPPA